METFIRLEKAAKEYGKSRILEDINLDIRSGEAVVFTGTNGVGKSTILKMIGGLIAPSGGKIHRKKGLLYHMVPERFPKSNLTARQYICAVGKIEGLRREEIQKKSADLFERFHMSGMEDKPMKLLSKGTLQKVGVIQAVLKRPDVLLLDEPLSGQDTASQAVFVELVNALKREGTALIISCHEEFLVNAVGYTVCRIEGGKMHTVRLERGKQKRKALITFEASGDRTAPELPVTGEAIPGGLRFISSYESSSEVVAKMIQEGFRLEDFTLVGEEPVLAGEREGNGGTLQEFELRENEMEKQRGSVWGMLSYEFRTYFKTNRFAMPFLVLMVFLFSLYSSMPVGVTDSFTISCNLLFLLMTWAGLSYNEMQQATEEQMMILRLQSETIYYFGQSLFLCLLGGIFTLVSLLIPLVLDAVNGGQLFSMGILLQDAAGGLLFMWAGAFLGSSLGTLLHPRVMKDRKAAVVLTVLIAVLAIGKTAILQDASWVGWVLYLLPPISDVTGVFAGTLHFTLKDTAFAAGMCILYGGILTAVRIWGLEKRKF